MQWLPIWAPALTRKLRSLRSVSFPGWPMITSAANSVPTPIEQGPTSCTSCFSIMTCLFPTLMEFFPEPWEEIDQTSDPTLNVRNAHLFHSFFLHVVLS